MKILTWSEARGSKRKLETDHPSGTSLAKNGSLSYNPSVYMINTGTGYRDSPSCETNHRR